MIDPEIRRLGIGGSEVAAILGLDDWRDGFSVWAEKKGGMPRQQPSSRMVLGKALEKGIFEFYKADTGYAAEWDDTTHQHPDRPWMIYTPDALVPTLRKGVDAKLVFYDQRRKWGETADRIPNRVQLQCWWYMAAFDWDTWDVVALIGEEVPRVYTVERNAKGEADMLRRCKRFWERYLQGDEEPPVCGPHATQYLQYKYPDPGPTIRRATEQEAALLAEYAATRNAEEIVVDQKKALEVQIKAAIANDAGLRWANGIFTWKKTKDGKETDWESMALGLMTNYIKDREARNELLAQYTKDTPGSRRIWFKRDEE